MLFSYLQLLPMEVIHKCIHRVNYTRTSLQYFLSMLNQAPTPGVDTPILGHDRRFRCDDLRFGDFQSKWVLFYTSTQSD